ncbi:MAG TPA: putative sulfate exporter family transporter [Devosiaceae bacterium]|jgi:uncharacterized integral membrane protein (TIGR00698 family)
MSLALVRSYLPGLMLATTVTVAAFALEAAQVALFGRAWLETLVLAILLGALVRTVWTPPAGYAPGLNFSSKFLLEIGVSLLGATTSAAALLGAGWPLLIAIAAVVAFSIPVAYAMGRLAGLGPRLATLIACGNSICGNSAIAAVAPVIGARSDEVAASIGFTAVLGIVAVLGLPVLAHLLGYTEPRFGILAGMTVYAVPQVLAATSAAGAVALHLGTIVKLVRVLMLGPVCLALAFFTGRGATTAKASRQFVPWFIVGFLALMLIHSAGWLPTPVSGAAGVVAQALTSVSMAALGLAVDLRAVRRAGISVTAVAAASLVLLALLAILAIKLVA